MDPKYLVPALLCIMLISVSAKENDPCTSTSECNLGEWCEGFRCIYHACSTDADCPTCGKCVSGACLREGNCDPNKPIIGEVIPLEPGNTPDAGAAPAEPESKDTNWTLPLLAIIAILLVIVIVLLARRK